MMQLAPVVFLLDVDNALLDNDRIIVDLISRKRLGLSVSSATGRSSRSGVRKLATRIISVPCSVIPAPRCRAEAAPSGLSVPNSLVQM